jgi:tRNA(Ile)-lysidine synthase TilS/MesJ
MNSSIRLLNFINRFFIQNKNLKPEKFLLIAFSAGQDSSFLFFVFLIFEKQWTLKFGLVCCNHLWQTESFYTFSHTFKLASLFKIPLFLSITEQKIFNEQKAKKWRLNTFQRIAFYYDADSIVNGHTASDRIETGLFHLLRGSGTQGIASFEYQKNLEKKKWTNFVNNQITKKRAINLFKKKIFFSIKVEKKFFKSKKKNKKFNFLITNVTLNNNKILLNRFFKIKNGNTFINSLKPSLFSNKSQLNSFVFYQKQDPEGSDLWPKHYLKKYFFFKNKKNINNFKFFNNTQLYLLPKKFLINYHSKFFYFNCYVFVSKAHTLMLLRPIGQIFRFDIQEICTFYKIPIFPDQSNQAFNFIRNRIRNQILPTFRFFFNPQIDRLLFQFIEIQSKEHYYFNFLIKKLLTSLKIYDKNTSFFNIHLINTLPLCIQRRVLKIFFKDFMNFHLNFSHIENLINAIDKYDKISIDWELCSKKKIIAQLPEGFLKTPSLTQSDFTQSVTDFRVRSYQKEKFWKGSNFTFCAKGSTKIYQNIEINNLSKKNKKILNFFVFQTPFYLFCPKIGFFIILY